VVRSVFKNPGLVLVLTYAALFAVNAAIIYLGNSFFPRQIVLGTVNTTLFWALLHTAGVLALIDTFAIPFAREIEQRRGRMLTSNEWMAGYFVLNFAGLWLLARFNDGFAFGLSGWYVAAALALVLDLVQGAAMMKLEKMRQKFD
jgi:hypothetical protein